MQPFTASTRKKIIRKSFCLGLLCTFLGMWRVGTAGAEPLKIGIMHFAPFLIVKGDETGGTELDRLKKVLNSQGLKYLSLIHI